MENSAGEGRTMIWALPIGVVSAVAIFAASFYACAERHRLHDADPYKPVGVGIVVFMLAMVALTAAVLPKERRRVGVLVGVVALETAAFSYALMFLLLNLYGS